MRKKRLTLVLVKEKSDYRDASSVAERTSVSKSYATEVAQRTISTKFAPL